MHNCINACSQWAKLYFYLHYNEEKYRNDIEIDFIINRSNRIKNKIIPIEVKLSINYTTTSLIEFSKKFNGRIDKAYIIYPKI